MYCDIVRKPFRARNPGLFSRLARHATYCTYACSTRLYSRFRTIVVPILRVGIVFRDARSAVDSGRSDGVVHLCHIRPRTEYPGENVFRWLWRALRRFFFISDAIAVLRVLDVLDELYTRYRGRLTAKDLRSLAHDNGSRPCTMIEKIRSI